MQLLGREQQASDCSTAGTLGVVLPLLLTCKGIQTGKQNVTVSGDLADVHDGEKGRELRSVWL